MALGLTGHLRWVPTSLAVLGHACQSYLFLTGMTCMVLLPIPRPAPSHSCLAATDLYRYLAQEHDATIIGVLLGMAASKRWVSWRLLPHSPGCVCIGPCIDASLSSSEFVSVPPPHALPALPAGAARTRPSARPSFCICPPATPRHTRSWTSRRWCRQQRWRGSAYFSRAPVTGGFRATMPIRQLLLVCTWCSAAIRMLGYGPCMQGDG